MYSRMGASIPIPRELMDFLKLPGPQSLLIRGPPGSGKTSLSLALLEAFSGARYYITNRVPGEDVLLAFPWIGENSSRGIKVVDNTGESVNLAQRARLLIQPVPTVLMDSPAESQELTEFLWLPEPLQEVWSRLEPNRPALVIIDSWDALVEAYLGTRTTGAVDLPSREEIERALIRRMGRSRTHLLFVLEREEQTHLDWLVNGVTVTSREVVHDRLERWLTLYKLRGVRIENPVYPFSLDSAHFECILPLKPYSHLRGGRFDPMPEVMPGHLWPGSKAFAASFGRLPLGGTTLIEADREVPNHTSEILLAPVLASTLERNGHVLMVPNPNTLPEDVWASVHGCVDKHRFLSNVRFLLPPPGPNQRSSEFDAAAVHLGRRTPASMGHPSEEASLERFLRSGASAESPGLLIVFAQGLPALANSLGLAWSAELATQLPSQIQSAVRGSPLHAVVVGVTDSPMLDPIRPTAALRLHLHQRQGRVFLYASDPWTPTFVLTEGTDQSPYGLLRVV